MASARATIAEIRRSIRAAEGLGKVVRGHEVEPDGTIRILYETEAQKDTGINPADLVEP